MSSQPKVAPSKGCILNDDNDSDRQTGLQIGNVMLVKTGLNEENRANSRRKLCICYSHWCTLFQE